MRHQDVQRPVRLMEGMDYGKILKEMRLATGLTQQQVADLLQVDRAHTSHIEQGRRKPSVDALERWIEICGGTLQILGPNETPDPLASLSPQQRTILEVAAGLTEKDQARLQEIAELLPKVDEMSKGSAIAGLRWAAGPEWAAEKGR